jgi:hypothetical protein
MLAVEVLVREPGDHRVDCDERGEAGPRAEIEQGNHGEREQRQHDRVTVHRLPMTVARRRVQQLPAEGAMRARRRQPGCAARRAPPGESITLSTGSGEANAGSTSPPR